MASTDLSSSLALEAVLAGDGVLDGLRDAAHLVTAVTRGAGDVSTEGLMDVVDGDDQLAGIAAVHAISALREREATAALQELLDDHRWHIAEHATWALSARAPHLPAAPTLAAVVAVGGFTGMLAQRTLAGWSRTVDVSRVVTRALRTATAPGARRRLVETLGLVHAGCDELLSVACDEAEGTEVRAAAIGALGDRRGDDGELQRLRRRSDELGEHAALALADRALLIRPATSPTQRLRVAQLYVHAELDDDPQRDGTGDHGGIATLLGLLAGELSRQPPVGSVLTIGRGCVADALTAAADDGPRSCRSWPVPFGPRGGVDPRRAWSYRVEIERGIRRALAAAGPIDVLHVRMSDVGTLAAARVARQLDIPVVFTAAPDPHLVIATAERDGTLTRANFGAADSLEHWWFRTRMVERLVGQAAAVALLPRAGGPDALGRFGIDVPADARVIPEGVHAATVLAASAAVTSGSSCADPSVHALRDLLADMPARRAGLPLMLTVGRLHPSKGMDRIARAWAEDPELRHGTNLVIVGGDLEHPSADELDVLLAIDEVTHGDTDGLVLLGHRPHTGVAHLFAAVAAGAIGARGGVYVAGARKEEFGLAIIEAMAAGLPVVAPVNGGPATYVSDGIDGVLVDTGSRDALAAGMHRALRLIDVPGRATKTSARVLATYTIEAMACSLAQLYDEVAHAARQDGS